ncbi:MAG: response regulator [Idiomarina sp.]|nr:response regulator [Idiomarina sp.]
MATILIADDDFISLEVLKAMLGQYPVTLLTAINGAEALELAQQHQPDLLILDYEMPDYTGAEVCAMLRGQIDDGIPTFANTPIVALTGHQSPNELNRCRDAGMNQTLHKPVAPDALKQLIEQYLPALQPSLAYYIYRNKPRQTNS